MLSHTSCSCKLVFLTDGASSRHVIHGPIVQFFVSLNIRTVDTVQKPNGNNVIYHPQKITSIPAPFYLTDFYIL